MTRSTKQLMAAVVAAALLFSPVSTSLVAADAAAGPASGAAAPAQGDPSARAQAAIDRGLAYLKTQQKPDGGWQADSEPPAISAIVLKAFAQDPKTGAKADFVKKGFDKLLTYQLENGGIYQDLLANYNTAIAVSALAAANDPAYKERIDRAVAYLKGLQWTEKTGPGPKGEVVKDKSNNWYGGYGYSKKGRPDGSNTQLSLDALKDAGLKADDPAFQAAVTFLTRLQNRTESNDQTWAVDDGGFVYSPANNGESMAGEFVGPDGKRQVRSYGSMTYAGLKSMIYAGVSKDDGRVKAAWDWIRKNYSVDENPGMKLSDPKQAEKGLFYYFHTMARALNAYDEPVITDAKGVKHDWRLELLEKLSKLQKEDGSWSGASSWMEDKPMLASAYAVLALQEIQKDLKEHPVTK